MTDGFDRPIVESSAHRPWPMPHAPWVMTQSWNNLLFATLLHFVRRQDVVVWSPTRLSGPGSSERSERH
jgi:hypothetical protein